MYVVMQGFPRCFDKLLYHAKNASASEKPWPLSLVSYKIVTIPYPYYWGALLAGSYVSLPSYYNGFKESGLKVYTKNHSFSLKII